MKIPEIMLKPLGGLFLNLSATSFAVGLIMTSFASLFDMTIRLLNAFLYGTIFFIISLEFEKRSRRE